MKETSIDDAMKMAVQFHQTRRLADAERIYRQILNRHPDHVGALHLLGVLAHHLGRDNEALDLIGRAIRHQPDFAEANYNLGLVLNNLGRFDEAIAAFSNAIQSKPDYARAHNNLGVALRNRQRYIEAAAAFSKATQVKPDYAGAHYNLGLALTDVGQLDEAIASYRQAIRIKPDFAEAYSNLGTALSAKGQLDQAIASYRQAIRLKPDFAEAHTNLGTALKDIGQLDQAIASYRQAIRLQPVYAEAHSNLGTALSAKGQLDEAIASYRHAIRIKPDFAEAHSNLGNALKDIGQLDEAIASYRQTIRLQPDFAEAYSNLGNALSTKGQLDQAISSHRQAIRVNPNFAGAHSNLGTALSAKGQLDEAIASYRQAIRLKPDFAKAHSNLVYTLHFHPGYDARMIYEERQRWNRQHAEPLKKFILPYINNRNPDRQLRIGYVSPDFREHPVGRSLLPLFANRDPRQLEIICYADLRKSDELTAKLREYADQWHNAAPMSDKHLAEQIRDNQIDLLVDTTLHTSGNRLLVFAREPAPVQLTMLGPPITTGLSTMHYRLTDPYLDPPGISDGDYTETSIRLPHCFWCYQPPANPAAVNDLPARVNGFVTFGCLNQFAKVTCPALELWLQILQSMPRARLMIQSEPGHHLDAVRKVFDGGGIAPDRLQFVAMVPRHRYFLRYHDLDLCLDPFPFNGHTSTMDALWMGVPTVTLRGRTAVGRGGVSILSNVGLTDWIADNSEQYVSIAKQMAGDLPRLAELRSTLRQRMQQSPLMDGKQFAHDVEAAFRRMWKNWCSKQR